MQNTVPVWFFAVFIGSLATFYSLDFGSSARENLQGKKTRLCLGKTDALSKLSNFFRFSSQITNENSEGFKDIT
jgi:hypothetical protein